MHGRGKAGGREDPKKGEKGDLQPLIGSLLPVLLHLNCLCLNRISPSFGCDMNFPTLFLAGQRAGKYFVTLTG